MAQRWTRLFSSDVLAKRYAESGTLDDAEWLVVKQRIDMWRERLTDISWFMRVLNESIARAANKEDSCTGRFWEGRYKSQALLGTEALLAAMVYVDLNPVRANIANTIPESDFTSGQQRFESLREEINPESKNNTRPVLVALTEQPESALPISTKSYLELLDYSGRLINANKSGYISEHQPPILDQLKFSNDQWRVLCKDFESPFRQFVGSYRKIKQACQQLGKTSLHGLGAAKRLFAT